MSFLSIFFSGIFFENIFVWHAIGLGTIVLFTYTLSESFWVGLRIILFLLMQTIIMIILKPWFTFPGKELFLLIVLIGFEVILSIIVGFLLPKSRLEESVVGFIRRGDAILPLICSVIIGKNFGAMNSIVYSLGLGIGFMLVLCTITAISINFNFHRLNAKHTYALKLFILGLLSMISY